MYIHTMGCGEDRRSGAPDRTTNSAYMSWFVYMEYIEA